tara:strand:- start:397 stop:810 length:414 start_codon:yes stop_codon:yes gene_type:complete
MNIEEIEKILTMVEESSLTDVKIKVGDTEIHVKKGGNEPPLFTKASSLETNIPKKTNKAPVGNIATPGQIKYARDLVDKAFDGSGGKAMDYLAHTLELPLVEIPDPDTWEVTLTKDMVGPIIDALDKMYKRQSKGGY